MQHGDLVEYRLGSHEASRGLIVRPVAEKDARAWVHPIDRPAYWIAWFDGAAITWAFGGDLTLISKASAE